MISVLLALSLSAGITLDGQLCLQNVGGCRASLGVSPGNRVEVGGDRPWAFDVPIQAPDVHATNSLQVGQAYSPVIESITGGPMEVDATTVPAGGQVFVFLYVPWAMPGHSSCQVTAPAPLGMLVDHCRVVEPWRVAWELSNPTAAELKAEAGTHVITSINYR